MAVFTNSTVNPGPFPTLKKSNQYRRLCVLMSQAWKDFNDLFEEALGNPYADLTVLRKSRQRLIRLGVPASQVSIKVFSM